ncbi:hypothetical protein F4810DRAFT_708483 [Camillea tinctor]|nr:hypothetical protein F4810DRAFT_708483 [Camillea tinctor]
MTTLPWMRMVRTPSLTIPEDTIDEDEYTRASEEGQDPAFRKGYACETHSSDGRPPPGYPWMGYYSVGPVLLDHQIGYIHYRACGHLVGPTHMPCRALGRCAGARANGVEFGRGPASGRFVEVCAACYACHLVRGADGAYRYVDM